MSINFRSCLLTIFCKDFESTLEAVDFIGIIFDQSQELHSSVHLISIYEDKSVGLTLKCNIVTTTDYTA